MLLNIPAVLNGAQLGRSRELLDRADWIDGRDTAGYQSSRVKQNWQLREDDPAAEELGEVIVDSLQRHPLLSPQHCRYAFFRRCSIAMRRDKVSARMSIMRFARRAEDVSRSHRHVGDAVLQRAGRIRRRGVVVEDTYGVHPVKFPAGHLVLYPAASLHHVTPVTRRAGMRRFSGFRAWSGMMVRVPYCSTWIRRSSKWDVMSRTSPASCS